MLIPVKYGSDWKDLTCDFTKSKEINKHGSVPPTPGWYQLSIDLIGQMTGTFGSKPVVLSIYPGCFMLPTGHVALVVITGTTILALYHAVNSQQVIWRMATHVHISWGNHVHISWRAQSTTVAMDKYSCCHPREQFYKSTGAPNKSFDATYVLLSLEKYNSQPIFIWSDYSWSVAWTHWGRVMHICFSKLTITGWDNGLSPGQPQAFIWTNAGILSIRPLGANFNEILIKIHTFSFNKIHLKLSSVKSRPSTDPHEQ